MADVVEAFFGAAAGFFGVVDFFGGMTVSFTMLRAVLVSDCNVSSLKKDSGRVRESKIGSDGSPLEFGRGVD